MAEQFRLQAVGGEPAPWSRTLPPEAVAEACRKVTPALHSRAWEDYGRFFYGTDGTVPYWFGYSLGFHLVGEAMRRSGRTAAELTPRPTEEILGLLGPEHRQWLGLSAG